jgi:hypothetical protein
MNLSLSLPTRLTRWTPNLRKQQTYGEVTFFACDYKSGAAGSFINGNLVQAVLGKGEYIDAQCGNARGGYERSNDLTIGRTFVSYTIFYTIRMYVSLGSLTSWKFRPVTTIVKSTQTLHMALILDH